MRNSSFSPFHSLPPLSLSPSYWRPGRGGARGEGMATRCGRGRWRQSPLISIFLLSFSSFFLPHVPSLLCCRPAARPITRRQQWGARGTTTDWRGADRYVEQQQQLLLLLLWRRKKKRVWVWVWKETRPAKNWSTHLILIKVNFYLSPWRFKYLFWEPWNIINSPLNLSVIMYLTPF